MYDVYIRASLEISKTYAEVSILMHVSVCIWPVSVEQI